MSDAPPMRLSVMYSEPQTLLCDADGLGVATTQGDDRTQRETFARHIAKCVNEAPRLNTVEAAARAVLESWQASCRWPDNDVLTRDHERAMDHLEKLFKGAP